jgi:hypothetical protein
MTHIVCYTGGTCGDLVTALIDLTGAQLKGSTVQHIPERARLKKPHLWSSDDEKDQYLASVTYNSISSHDLDYHRSRSHRFITVIIEEFDSAIWAAGRFRDCHRPAVWQEMMEFCGATCVEEYAEIMMHYSRMVVNHTADVLTLEDILQGRVISELQRIIGHTISSDALTFYQHWLKAQHP